MLGYECPKCGAIKFPDGKGCQCGESYYALKVVRLKNTLKPEKDKEYYGELNDPHHR